MADQAQIMIKGLTGGTFTVDADVSDSIDAIKKTIQAKTGIPAAHQSLIFSGKQLDDSLTLNDYGCGKGSTVQLVSGLRGGVGWGISFIAYTTKKTTVVEGAGFGAGGEEGSSSSYAIVQVNDPARAGRTVITEEDSGYGIRFHVI